MNRYQGDPKLVLGENGSYLVYKGGQPVMDQGLENQIQIQYLTEEGWCGNVFLPTDRRIGSNFLVTARGAITIDKLNDIRQASENALKNQAFGKIATTVNNPTSDRLDVETIVESPGKDIQVLTLIRNRGNWVAQAKDPAYRRI
ncbi:hypothetical protein AMJ80_02345 [bacterium SM23_31]|nr:MAG: hypothetical protein AMJ80_02345 [bacterium SM23_31]